MDGQHTLHSFRRLSVGARLAVGLPVLSMLVVATGLISLRLGPVPINTLEVVWAALSTMGLDGPAIDRTAQLT